MATQSATTKWAKRISAAWQKSLKGILECGDCLVRAKRELKHGEFQKMIEAELPFDSSTAQRLMMIARDRRLRNPAHAQLLPSSWYVLYRLSRLSDAKFNQLLAAGRIRPDMERKLIEPSQFIEVEKVGDAQPQPPPPRKREVEVVDVQRSRREQPAW